MSTTRAAERGTESREEILDAAAVAFMARGYAGTSIADIADLLGATKGRIYHWYRSKAQIYLDVHRRAMEMLFAVIEPIVEEESAAEERLFRMVVEHVRMMMTALAYQRVSVQSLDMRGIVADRDLSDVRAEVITLRDRYEELFAQVIAEGIDEGAFRPTRGRLATKPLFGAVNWITMWFEPGRTGTIADEEEICQEMATFVVHGLRKDGA